MSRRSSQAATAPVPPTCYDILQAPVITEKSTMAVEHNKVTFRVRRDASKPQVKQAVERIFGVTVTAVHMIRLPGKCKRFRGVRGKQQDKKKAIVTLKHGDTIDVMAKV